MKNFYVIRDCPYPAPKQGSVLGYSRTVAKTWDVKYIMQANDNLPSQALYKHIDGSLIYFEQTDYHTFNMLDAFGIPHLDDYTQFTVITPQVVANRDGTRDVTVSGKKGKPVSIGQYLMETLEK